MPKKKKKKKRTNILASASNENKTSKYGKKRHSLFLNFAKRAEALNLSNLSIARKPLPKGSSSLLLSTVPLQKNKKTKNEQQLEDKATPYVHPRRDAKWQRNHIHTRTHRHIRKDFLLRFLRFFVSARNDAKTEL